jgi:predicted dehydrogenase
MQLNYKPQMPRRIRPIVIIGAGSIVRDAHLPAYARAGFPVHAITNRTRGPAEELAARWNIGRVEDSIADLIANAPPDAVYDLTLPAGLFAGVLRQLPRGAAVLIQKPMGETIAEAKEILAVCRQRSLVAAINLQLRFAPFVMAAHDLIQRGVIGELRDMEIRVTTMTPWDHFPFLKDVKRLEIVYHSIHHIDCIRHFLGTPRSVYAKTLRHPDLAMPESRSSIIMDYGDRVRANIQTNHFHKYGPRHQESYIKWEGSHGCIKAKMGLLMNYPAGLPDAFEVCTFQDGEPVWQSFELEGTWFPDAFVGSMAQVMRAADGETHALVTSVEDIIETAACAEAAYASSDGGGTAVAPFLAT